jgi:hypothetical protein
MKTLVKFMSIGLLLAGTASAKISDFTVFRTVAPHQSKSVSLDIEPGNATIDISSMSTKGLISCELSNADGVDLQSKVQNCVFNFKVKNPSSYSLKVTNETDSPIDFRAFLHESKR